MIEHLKSSEAALGKGYMRVNGTRALWVSRTPRRLTVTHQCAGVGQSPYRGDRGSGADYYCAAGLAWREADVLLYQHTLTVAYEEAPLIQYQVEQGADAATFKLNWQRGY